MKQMDKLHELFKLCKAGVFIEYNEHKLYNDTVAEFLIGQGEREYIETYVFDKMVELDTIISIEFYPDKHVMSHSVLHYDLDLALGQCLEIIANLTSDMVFNSTENVI